MKRVIAGVRGFFVTVYRLIRQLWAQGSYLMFLAAYDKLARMVTGHPTWRFTHITPEIWLGAQPAKWVWPTLSKAGITGVVNLRQEYDYQHEIGSLPLKYLYLPTEDNTAPTLDQMRRGAAFITTEIQQGGRVYIHCWEGLGRGPTMAATYFVSIGATPAEAWAKIRRVRPFIRPTASQQQRLEEFAASLNEQ